MNVVIVGIKIQAVQYFLSSVCFVVSIFKRFCNILIIVQNFQEFCDMASCHWAKVAQNCFGISGDWRVSLTWDQLSIYRMWWRTLITCKILWPYKCTGAVNSYQNGIIQHLFRGFLIIYEIDIMLSCCTYTYAYIGFLFLLIVFHLSILLSTYFVA